MCHVLNVKPSSYYDWLSRDISTQQIHRNQNELLVRVVHRETKQRYDIYCSKRKYRLNKQFITVK